MRVLQVLMIVFFFAPGAWSAEPQTTQPRSAPPDVTIAGNVSDVVVPLKRGNDLLFTDSIRINGQPVGICVVDSGANMSVFDAGVVRKLKLEVAPSTQPSATVLSVFSVRSVDIGAIHAVPQWIASADLTRQFGLNPKIQGIIGGDLLGLLPFTLDAQKPSLTFHSRRSFKPPAGATKTAFELHGRVGAPGYVSSSARDEIFFRDNPQAGYPVATVKIDGISATALLDTGFTGRVNIGERFTKLHPGMIDAAGAEQPYRSAADNRMPRGAKIGALELFGKSVTDLRGSMAVLPSDDAEPNRMTPKTDLTIGRLVLNNFLLTFDYENRTIWAVERPMPAVSARLSSGQLKPNDADLFGLTPLMGAARDGDVAGVAALLKAGAGIAAEMDDGSSVLHIAATNGRSEIMALLLRQPAATKAFVNSRAAAGNTPLVSAANFGNSQNVSLLLKAGADPNIGTRSGFLPIHAAAGGNDARSIQLLLEAGADCNAQAATGLTPAGVAAEHGAIAALDALAGAGARLEGTRGNRIPLLHLAARTGQTEMIEHLLTKYAGTIPVDSTSIDGSTALLIAAESGHPKAVAALLKAGARPGIAADGIGRAMPLHLAARNGNPETIALLLKAKAPIDAPNKQGLTPLMAAADAGQLKALAALLDAGASIDAKDGDGLTAIHIAARENRGDVVRLLVKRGANPNSKGLRDIAPLHMAVLNGAGDAITALIECKADPKAVTSGGVSPIDLAHQTGNKRLIQMLEPTAK